MQKITVSVNNGGVAPFRDISEITPLLKPCKGVFGSGCVFKADSKLTVRKPSHNKFMLAGFLTMSLQIKKAQTQLTRKGYTYYTGGYFIVRKYFNTCCECHVRGKEPVVEFPDVDNAVSAVLKKTFKAMSVDIKTAHTLILACLNFCGDLYCDELPEIVSWSTLSNAFSRLVQILESLKVTKPEVILELGAKIA